jgi:hypothetical protein
MKKLLVRGFVLCFSLTLLVSACNKKETVEVDNETQSAVDNAVAEQEFMSIVPAANSHAINTKGTGTQGKPSAPPCDTLALISGDTLWGTTGHVDPTYTMNVSNSACNLTLPDGRTRIGSLSIRLTGKIKLSGSQMIIKMIGYRAAGIAYSCDSLVVTTVTTNPNYNTFNVKLVNGVCKSLASWTINYSLDRTITFYPNGNASSDPVTYIYGTSNGKNREGRAFEVVIPQTSALTKYQSCQYISAGVLQLTPKDFATRTIDYGYSIAPAQAGGCDEDASFSVNGNTVAFKLK